jgi:CheY-like chemotaxis protein
MLRAARAEGRPFDLALIDHLMPGMNGEVLGRAVKSDPELRSTVLLMLTSSPGRGDGALFREAGFAAYFGKPIRPVDLGEAMVQAWGERHVEGAALITQHTLAERRSAIRAAEVGPAAAKLEARTFHCRVLVAEDNTINQLVAVRMLQRLGCTVDVAANGREAVDMVHRLPYDLVFMDCQMPEMDGYEATAAIRAGDATQCRIPIVAMTADALAGTRELCLAAGMDDYVSKPIDTATLRGVLERHVGSSAHAENGHTGAGEL